MPDNNYNPNNQRFYQEGQAQNAQGAYGGAPVQGAPGTKVTGVHSQSAQQRPSVVGAVTVGTAAAGGAATAAAVQSSKKSPFKRPAVIAGICVVVVALVVALVALLMPKNDFYDGNSIIGQAPYKTTEEIQAELDRIVEEGMLNISIASVIEFENGESEGTAYIENVPGNRYVMKVDITLDDTGEKVYESGGLKPGSYIEKIKLSKDLDAGTYSATATFHALDSDTLNEIGSAAAIVTLNVLS